jgi:hypothetical protein
MTNELAFCVPQGEKKDGKVVEWMEHVSDEQYFG